MMGYIVELWLCKYIKEVRSSQPVELNKIQFFPVSIVNNIVEENDTFINTFHQKPNFNYYENHQFHKLVNKLPENKMFSLLHTDICSFQGNFESLQNLISNLGHKFSAIAVSETWTPNNDKSDNKPKTLESYQHCHGVTSCVRYILLVYFLSLNERTCQTKT